MMPYLNVSTVSIIAVGRNPTLVRHLTAQHIIAQCA
jgi:hypothetical protein